MGAIRAEVQEEEKIPRGGESLVEVKLLFFFPFFLSFLLSFFLLHGKEMLCSDLGNGYSCTPISQPKLGLASPPHIRIVPKPSKKPSIN